MRREWRDSVGEGVAPPTVAGEDTNMDAHGCDEIVPVPTQTSVVPEPMDGRVATQETSPPLLDVFDDTAGFCSTIPGGPPIVRTGGALILAPHFRATCHVQLSLHVASLN